jgi:hypothetical protein
MCHRIRSAVQPERGSQLELEWPHLTRGRQRRGTVHQRSRVGCWVWVATVVKASDGVLHFDLGGRLDVGTRSRQISLSTGTFRHQQEFEQKDDSSQMGSTLRAGV